MPNKKNNPKQFLIISVIIIGVVIISFITWATKLRIENPVDSHANLNSEIINFLSFLVTLLVLTITLFIAFVGVEHYFRLKYFRREMKEAIADVKLKCIEMDEHNKFCKDLKRDSIEVQNELKLEREEIRLSQKRYYELVNEAIDCIFNVITNVRGNQFNSLMNILNERILIFQTYSPEVEERKIAVRNIGAQGTGLSNDRLHEIIKSVENDDELKQLAIDALIQIKKQ